MLEHLTIQEDLKALLGQLSQAKDEANKAGKEFDVDDSQYQSFRSPIIKLGNAEIDSRLNQIQKLYAECEDIAKACKITFYTSGPAYGMGGSFDWNDSYDTDNTEGSWNSSSNNC